MDEWFKKAPLKELIAELRWAPVGVLAPEPGGVAMTFDGAVDEFFMRFAGKISVNDFTQAERLVPVGVPYFPHNIAYRFRRPNNLSSLLQVGAGIFSANALPPYKRWHEFRPTVEAGVRALLEARRPEEAEAPFTGVSLRYIDGFSAELLGGKSESAFIEQTLGFRVVLPAPVETLVTSDQPVNTSIGLVFPAKGTTKTVRLNIGDGVVGGERAAVMDTTVSESSAIAPNVDAVMKALDSSRDIIHKTFVDLTTPVHTLMEFASGSSNAPS